MADSGEKSTGSPWNSLEIAKLIVAALVPLSIFVFGTIYTASTRAQEARRLKQEGEQKQAEVRMQFTLAFLNQLRTGDLIAVVRASRSMPHVMKSVAIARQDEDRALKGRTPVSPARSRIAALRKQAAADRETIFQKAAAVSEYLLLAAACAVPSCDQELLLRIACADIVPYANFLVDWNRQGETYRQLIDWTRDSDGRGFAPFSEEQAEAMLKGCKLHWPPELTTAVGTYATD